MTSSNPDTTSKKKAAGTVSKAAKTAKTADTAKTVKAAGAAKTTKAAKTTARTKAAAKAKTAAPKPEETCKISELDRYLYGQGSHYRIYEKLGAHPYTENCQDGYYFAVWAPQRCR